VHSAFRALIKLRGMRSLVRMDTVSAFIETVGRQGFAEQTGFAQQSISRAISENVMPARWYLAVRAICVARGIAVPDQLFRWADRCGPVQRRGKAA
jgi:hypothetical protein